MDIALFRFLNGLAGQSVFSDRLLVLLASYLPYLLVVALLWSALRRPRRLQMLAGATVAVTTARGLLKPLIVFFWHRPRPFMVLQNVRQLIDGNHGEEFSSFPSGHALFFFALAWAVYRHDRRLGKWLLIGAMLMSVGRVAAGIHWPSDILAGAALGILISELLVRFVPALRPK